MEQDLNFGGRNKARRIARLVKKGKTEKAQKLADKVAAKIAKLEEKGKGDSKRYKFLADKLAKAGEAGLTLAELSELETMTEDAVADDVELKAEIDNETQSETWINGVPNLAVIVASLALVGGIVWISVPYFKGISNQNN